MMIEPNGPLLTEAAVAKRLGDAVTVPTLRNWRFLGRGPDYLKIGKRVLYRADDVDRWITSRVRSAEGKPA